MPLEWYVFLAKHKQKKIAQIIIKRAPQKMRVVRKIW